MSIARFQATHGIIANAPATVVIVSDDPVLSPRLFTGAGAPSATTLNAGNGRYGAATSGWVMGATLVSAGTGYAVGNVLTVSGGTATTAGQIIVEAVTATGAIVNFHFGTAGNYSAYPTNPAGVTGGAGNGATFNLAVQPPDLYFDTTGKNLYVCTTAGSNAGSGWTQVGSTVQYYAITALGNYDYMVCVPLIVSGAGSGLSVAFGTGPVNVAKHNRMRPSVGSESIDGYTITYTAYTADNTRTASDGTNTEYQVAFPRYVTAATLGYGTAATLTGAAAYAFLESQCVIKAAPVSGGCGFNDVFSNYIFWEELTPRVWARRYNQ